MFSCRSCNNNSYKTILDLGQQPPSNAYLKSQNSKEVLYPLCVVLCKKCKLLQTLDYISEKKIFNKNYAYFSSVSKSWLNHCENFVNKSIKKFKLNYKSKVLEIASNDGYLLQYFQKKKIFNIGIEPTLSTHNEALKKGIFSINKFFGKKLALNLVKSHKFDLIIANNVVAHVPNLNDFLSGVEILLNKKGSFVAEFPHLLNLIKEDQFDTIYHEHFSYFSLNTFIKALNINNLLVYDVELVNTHGGSLRVYSSKLKNKKRSKNLNNLIIIENNFKINHIKTYDDFNKRVFIKLKSFKNFIEKNKLSSKPITCFGAAAKGNTLLNSCNVNKEDIHCIFDSNPNKVNLYMPGSKIPIYGVDKIKSIQPKIIIILPWNLGREISSFLEKIINWDCKIYYANKL